VLKDIAITCVSRVEGKGTWVVGKKGDTEEFYTAEQVGDMIEMLSAKNAQGYDIYVTQSTRADITFCLTT